MLPLLTLFGKAMRIRAEAHFPESRPATLDPTPAGRKAEPVSAGIAAQLENMLRL